MSPYADLPKRAFWKAGVLGQDPTAICDLYLRKFEIRPRDRIAIAGTGFARHLNKALRMNGYRVLDLEPAPPWLDACTLHAHGYGANSARLGEIQTARQLLQLAREALEGFIPSEVVWSRKGRFHDAHRPGVDPRGLDSADEVLGLRADHLGCVREMFETMNVLFVSLGQIEAWADLTGETVFPTAPGTIAGTWDEARYRFFVQSAAEVLTHLKAFRDLIASVTRNARMIVSVSPAAPAATGSDAHVLVASAASKAALRTAMGEFAAQDPGVDYFPLHDLVSSPAACGAFLGPDLGSLSESGRAAVLRMFFDQHPPVAGDESIALSDEQEEELLEAFAR